MPQTTNASVDDLDANPSKRPDIIIAISGHPTLFSLVSASHTLSAGSHDLSSTNGFTTIYAWTEGISISPTKLKGAFPESGSLDLGSMEVEIHDKHGESTISRDLTELLSRQAFREGVLTGSEYTLGTAGLAKAATDVVLVSTTGIAAGSTIWIGLEAIKVGTINGDGVTLNGCTRGYLLTNDQRHAKSVKVYGYIPSIEGRPIHVFKGYQDLALSSWLKAWAGTITEAWRSAPAKVKLKAKPFTWEMWGGAARGGKASPSTPVLARPGAKASPIPGVRRIVRLGELTDETEILSYGAFTVNATSFANDFTVELFPLGATSAAATTFANALADGHHVVQIGDSIFGIASLIAVGEVALAGYGGFSGKFNVVKVGPAHGNEPLDNEAPVKLGWSNATFSATAAPTGSDPIDLILQLLCSTGNGTNGAYDDFRTGVGLGVPVEKIDLASFTNVQAENDYDTNLRVFFVFTEPTEAKTFIEDQLCKPFGWYLATGNDGKIKLVRPKNPEKIYFSKANNAFTFTFNYGGTNPDPNAKTFALPAGVYTPAQVATELQAGFRTVTGSTALLVRYNSQLANGFDLDGIDGSLFTFTVSDAWRTIGFTSSVTDLEQPVANVTVGVFSDTSTYGVQTIDKDDIHSGTLQSGVGDQVGRVSFACNYDWAQERFRSYKLFTDAEIENLSAFGQLEPYVIEAKGLLRAFTPAAGALDTSMLVEAATGGVSTATTSTLYDVSSSFAIDISNSYASLFACHMFDRYRNPPNRLKLRCKWRLNTLEVGDEVLLTHDVDGATIDMENGTATITSRTFEVVSVKPMLSPDASYVELELLGHRDGGPAAVTEQVGDPSGEGGRTRGGPPSPKEYWGGRISSALRLDNALPPETGRALTLRRDRVVTGRDQLRGEAIRDGSLGVEKLGGGMRDQYFGGGRDGEADFDSTSTVLGLAPSSGVYTLTRDIACTRIHVRAGATIRPAGYRIMCRELHLWGSAIIHADGAVGGNGSGATAGAKGDPIVNESSANSRVIGGGEAGGPGGAGGTTASQGGAAGTAGDAISVGLGGDGATGSDGASVGGGGGGGTGGAAGTVSGTDGNPVDLFNATRLMRGTSLMHGGAGGGGGGGGGATAGANDGGGGGGGGAGGGVINIAADEVILHSWTGRISADGGGGGTAGQPQAGAGYGGGGAGGGGGMVVFVYATLSGGALIRMPGSRNATSLTADQTTAGANVHAWGGLQGSIFGGPLATLHAPRGAVYLLGPQPFVPVAEDLPPLTRPFAPRRRTLHAGHMAAMRIKYQLE